MGYIDGVILAVPEANKEAYRDFASDMAALFIEYGATEVVDTWGSDVPDGELTSFPMAVKRAPGEAVVFGWVRWPSRAVRDEAWPRVMADPRMTGPEAQAADDLFDGKRMIFGGFEVIQHMRSD